MRIGTWLCGLMMLGLGTASARTQGAPLAAQAQTLGPSSHPDSKKGLEKLVGELHRAAEAQDQTAFAELARPLTLPNASVWYVEVFGDRLGTYAASDHATRVRNFVAPLWNSFQQLRADGYEKLEVVRLEEPCTPGVLQNEYPLLFSRKKDVPLYGVRYRKGTRYRSFGFFAHVDGGFRYLGHVALPPGPKDFRKEAPKLAKDKAMVVVGGNVQQAKLITRPRPIYPDKARAARIRGTVRLQAIIAKDGSVQDLQLMSGHCWLAEAAIESVSKWRYSPTLLEGQPVEVSTTIDVVFTLSR